MADTKLSGLPRRESAVGDPFNDLHYIVLSEPAADADKERSVTPWDLYVGYERTTARFKTDLIVMDMPTYGNAGSSNQVDQNHQGIARIYGTNADDGGGFWGTYRGVCMQGGAIRLLFIVKTEDTLSTSGDRYIVQMGLPAEGDSQLNQEGIYVKYSDNVNGGRWQLVTRSGGVESTADTGVTVQADTWYRIQIDIAADASSASCTINGGSPVTVSTNVYDQDATLNVGFRKVSGTNERGLVVDFISFMKHLQAGR
ncbi:hypothetical protein FHP25_31310 [Vineibacter terrae]|uniref:SO2946-like C-terminal domain-containing protein n=1 Tax=Vineibacter terrae TaxID=2586908 RepID=A0A5C8PBM3_9HYPH|nr:hypothetical protein [Vineibacter terrae]TXL71199.1 hypothetical protein FHP25_31310 [Vineibacter terrae]